VALRSRYKYYSGLKLYQLETQTLLNTGTKIEICLRKCKGQTIWRLLAKLTWRFQEEEVLDFYSEM